MERGTKWSIGLVCTGDGVSDWAERGHDTSQRHKDGTPQSCPRALEHEGRVRAIGRKGAAHPVSPGRSRRQRPVSGCTPRYLTRPPRSLPLLLILGGVSITRRRSCRARRGGGRGQTPASSAPGGACRWVPAPLQAPVAGSRGGEVLSDERMYVIAYQISSSPSCVEGMYTDNILICSSTLFKAVMTQ